MLYLTLSLRLTELLPDQVFKTWVVFLFHVQKEYQNDLEAHIF